MRFERLSLTGEAIAIIATATGQAVPPLPHHLIADAQSPYPYARPRMPAAEARLISSVPAALRAGPGLVKCGCASLRYAMIP